MIELKQYLAERLEGVEKLAILGAGSRLKADDCAGTEVADRLIKRFGEAGTTRLMVYSGETAPENYTGEIKRFGPNHLILIDAADFMEQPGAISSIQPCAVSGVSFSTHMLPLKVMLEYLSKEIACQTTILGIQPASTAFGAKMSSPVKEAVDELVSALEELIVENGFAE